MEHAVGDDAFVNGFERALTAPLVGPARRPARVRIESHRLAAELQARFGNTFEIIVAPTPELGDLTRMMADHLRDQSVEHASYFEEGRVSEPAIAEMFRVAAALYAVVPWKMVDDFPPLRADIAELGVEGGCLVAIGASGESRALLMFPSLAAYEAFGRASDHNADVGRIDSLGASVLAISFDHADELPTSLRREVKKHGWQVAGPKAYPVVDRRDQDGVCMPITEQDVRVITACASALVAFYGRHAREISRPRFPPISESIDTSPGFVVRVTAPYEDFDLFEPAVDATEHAAPVTAGRNDPCPCGSGKKYKRCHLPLEREQAAPKAAAQNLRDRDDALVRELYRYARRRFGAGFHERLDRIDESIPAVEQFRGPFALYHAPVEGRAIVDWFLGERSAHLSAEDRAILHAQQNAWFSVWEVRDVEPGVGMTLVDLLTGESRRVQERSGSRTLVARDGVLARVTELGGVQVVCGMYPRALSPESAARVVEAVRKALKSKHGPVPVERMRDVGVTLALIELWQQSIDEDDARNAVPPKLHNTDGDPLLLTVDHFAFEAVARDRLKAALATLDGVVAPEPDDEEESYDFLRPGNALHKDWDNTVVGRAFLVRNELRVETNSTQRADALRERIEGAAGQGLRHRAREHSDPLSERVLGQVRKARDEEEMPPPEVLAMLREQKQRSYEAWLGERIPALGGKTPRQAVRSKSGRAQLDVVLKTIENHEARLPAQERFDIAKLRAELGLEP